MTPPSSSPTFAGSRASLKDYLQSAFLYRWNMLIFLGATAAAALSPWPSALLPLVAAIETAYLGAIVGSPKFRKAIDAKVHKQASIPPAAESARTLHNAIESISKESRERFERLRERCLEMRAIAGGVRGRGFSVDDAAEDQSANALDRLLWVFLRLLVVQEALSRFLAGTNSHEISAQLEEARSKLAAGTSSERLQRSLEDSVAVQQSRLENYSKTEADAEFVRVELDRIEAKIHALTEASIHRQDAEFLVSQIDSVAESMQSTEKAISELQQLTGIASEIEEPPAILSASGGAGFR